MYCPYLPFVRDSYGVGYPRDCLGDKCQLWWKCKEPDVSDEECAPGYYWKRWRSKRLKADALRYNELR
jgi:hypothetical protein